VRVSVQAVRAATLPLDVAIVLYYKGNPAGPRPIHFVGSSLKDLRNLPELVQDVVGAALLDAQYGDRPEGARQFGEGLPREVMRLAADRDGDAFRVAYVASLPAAVYVLHAFRKKSKKGVSTPRRDLDRIRKRLGFAERHHKETYGPP
jgi:phage-related protein